MEELIVKAFLEMGTTGAFLVYLYIRNGKHETALKGVSDTLDRVNESQERNTRVLIKVAQKHKLLDDADDLIEI